MSVKILITGGSGMLGMALSQYLKPLGFDVRHLSRKPSVKNAFQTYKWDPRNDFVDVEALKVDHVIHLAGAGVAEKRWTKKRKDLIYRSRIDSADLLRSQFVKNNIKLKSFVSASAIGYYPYDDENSMTEDTPGGEGFLPDLVEKWEQSADAFSEIADSVAKVRIGIVLSRDGGALPKMSQPIKWGLGSPLGSGKQVMSWIHLKDLVRIFHFILTEQLSGTYNAVSPSPVTNEEMTHAISKAVGRSIVLPNVPGFVLKLVFGEMADILLKGQNVSSVKLENSGFEFDFDSIDKAMKDLYKPRLL